MSYAQNGSTLVSRFRDSPCVRGVQNLKIKCPKMLLTYCDVARFHKAVADVIPSIFGNQWCQAFDAEEGRRKSRALLRPSSEGRRNIWVGRCMSTAMLETILLSVRKGN